MKILIYSSVFWPSIGGIESITDTLASSILDLGHQCTVVTETSLNKGQEEIERSYEIVRSPSLFHRFNLVKGSDLVHSNGASVALYPFAKLANKPFIWTHNGYQVSCIDGLGWVNGEPAPLSPYASLKYHYHKFGLLFAVREAVKLGFRRYVANSVDLNIAATHWIAHRQPLPNQVVAYTPYPLNHFSQLKAQQDIIYDFLYVGRLVSEKGIPELIYAFHSLCSIEEYKQMKLAVVGDGNLKEKVINLVTHLNLKENVFLLGAKRNPELASIINQSHIAIVPSAWEEPMGGVCLELLAMDKPLITSSNGGHAECVGEAGLTFPNGDQEALFQTMLKLLRNPHLIETMKTQAAQKVEEFNPLNLTNKYIEIYESVIKSYKNKI